MSEYSVAEAKNNLPKLLDRALAGEEVAITRRGKLIARIVPEQSAQAALDKPKSPTDVEWIRRHAVTPKAKLNAADLIRRMARRIPVLSLYFDASVIVPLFVRDDHTERIYAWLGGLAEPPLVSGWAITEYEPGGVGRGGGSRGPLAAINPPSLFLNRLEPLLRLS